jgi:hypothetical protein
MKLRYSSFFLSLSTFLIVGCSTPSVYIPGISNNSDKNGICQTEPEWVLHTPVENGVIYGVGVAPPNFNGEAAQRKSAIAKAVNEIASQLNTTVNSQTMSKSTLNNHSANHSISTVSFQTVNGQKVSSKIVKSCKNPNNNYLYILMKADKGTK